MARKKHSPEQIVTLCDSAWINPAGPSPSSLGASSAGYWPAATSIGGFRSRGQPEGSWSRRARRKWFSRGDPRGYFRIACFRLRAALCWWWRRRRPDARGEILLSRGEKDPRYLYSRWPGGRRRRKNRRLPHTTSVPAPSLNSSAPFHRGQNRKPILSATGIRRLPSPGLAIPCAIPPGSTRLANRCRA